MNKIKLLVGVAVVTVLITMVLSYNKALATVEKLKQDNAVLKGAVEVSNQAANEERRLRAEVEALLAEKSIEVEVIHETEIKTIEVVRTVQAECLDTSMPVDIIEQLRF